MIRTREQLLDWLAEHGTRSIKRTLAQGTVEVLGGFNTNPPCWMVRVTSAYGRVWDVAVIPGGKMAVRYQIEKSIPWQLWAGGKSSLYHGDAPELCERLRDRAKGD